MGESYPELAELLTTIGEAGLRVSDIDASEGAAAMYKDMDLVDHSRAEGLTQFVLRTVVEAFNVPTNLV